MTWSNKQFNTAYWNDAMNSSKSTTPFDSMKLTW